MSQPHTPAFPTPPPLPPGFGAGATSHPPPPPLGPFDPPFGADLPPAYPAAAAASGWPASAHRRRFPIGTAAWGLAAAAAIAYLSVVLLRPDLVARVDTAAPALAEIETLRGEVDGLRRDVADIRTTVSETASQQKVIFEKLAALSAPVTGPIPAAEPGAPGPGLRLDSVPVNGALAPRADTAPAPAEASKKVADAKVLNAKPGLETGSVKPGPGPAPASAAKAAAAAAEPPPFGEPVVTPAAKPVGVQIATGPSLDSLRLSWNLLSDTHADKLKALEPRYSISVDNGAVVYNLMAGPVKTEADAKKMCKALAAKAVPCRVVSEFGGAAL